ncbi:MAG: P-loop NTPase [Desulfobacterales bacterium]|nr:P-loop NTPase [Desulfobacterales bacterium]
MKEKLEAKEKSTPKVWAVGGGKGGVGKSIISTLLALGLARMGKRTILFDADLGGANLHILIGIKSPPRTLNDFITRKYKSLEDTCIDSDVENLRLISGASEILSMANPKFAQKMKIIQNVDTLDADNVVLDLGAGASFNTLDFFLAADRKIAVLAPQATSIQSAYAFVRNAVYRRLSQLSSSSSSLQELVQGAMNPKNEMNVRTIKDLFGVIQESFDKETVESLHEGIGKIRPAMITNMVKDARDKDMGGIIKTVAEKYLLIQAADLGGVVYDQQIEAMVSRMVPLTQLDQSSEAYAAVYEVASRLLRESNWNDGE